MAGQEHRPALGLRLADELVERLLDERVEARRGLVEHQQLRAVLQRDRPAPTFCLLPFEYSLNLRRRVDVEALDQRRRWYAVSTPPRRLREVLDRLAAGQAVVEGELAGDVADPAVDRDRVHGRLDAEHERAAARRPDEVEQRPDGGRLAGAVRAEEAEHLAGLDLQVDVDDAAVVP